MPNLRLLRMSSKPTSTSASRGPAGVAVPTAVLPDIPEPHRYGVTVCDQSAAAPEGAAIATATAVTRTEQGRARELRLAEFR